MFRLYGYRIVMYVLFENFMLKFFSNYTIIFMLKEKYTFMII